MTEEPNEPQADDVDSEELEIEVLDEVTGGALTVNVSFNDNNWVPPHLPGT